MVEFGFSTRQFYVPPKEREYTEGIPLDRLDDDDLTYIVSPVAIGLVDT